MNLFILDADPNVSAICHTDKHVVKMPTETAQMLSFVYHDPAYWDKPIPEFIMAFSKTHYKHPCSIWIRESRSNFLYAAHLGLALYCEYQYRYANPAKHQRAKMIFDYAINYTPALPQIGLTKFVTAMDAAYTSEDPIESYRRYYRDGKQHLHSWRKREKPIWIF